MNRKARLAGWPTLAVTMIALTSLKPFHCDDVVYHEYAAHIATHFADPLEFDVLLSQQPKPAHQIQFPLVFPYIWAVAIRLVGDWPAAGNLASVPFLIVFCWALDALLRRFAGNVSRPFLWCIALSPAVLPGINRMLDVPSMALALAAVETFLRSCETTSARLAIVSGLCAGLAIEIKYTALVVPACLVLAGVFQGHARRGVVATVVTMGVFAACEYAVAALTGHAIFLEALRRTSGATDLPIRLGELAVSVIAIAGATHLTLPLVSLAAMRVARFWLGAATAVTVGSFVLIAVFWTNATYHLENVLFGAVGIFGWIALAVLIRSNFASSEGSTPPINARRMDAFLVAWLLLELAAFFVISPFPATRRLLGIAIVAGLIVARKASHSLDHANVLNVRGAAIVTILLGLAMNGLDVREADARRRAVRQSLPIVASDASTATCWFTGHWGFDYYARQAGYRAVVPGASQIRRGDWVVIPADRFYPQSIDLDPRAFRHVGQIRVDDSLRLKSFPSYYAGIRPIEHRRLPRFEVDIYRASADAVPAAPLDAPPEVRQ